MALSDKKIASAGAMLSIAIYLFAIFTFAYSLYQAEIPSEAKIRKLASDKDLASIIYEISASNFSALKMAIFSIVLFLVFESVSKFLDGKISQNRVQEQYDRLFHSLNTSLTIQYVGQSSDINQILKVSIGNAKTIYNSFMNMGGFDIYNREQEAEIVKMYEFFLSKGPQYSWYDILSVNEVHNFRHQRIFKDTVGRCGKHCITILRSNMPIINFIILENPAIEFKEVYFGWINSTMSENSPIFRSSDVKVIEMFRKLYMTMISDKAGESWKPDYSLAPAERGPITDFAVDKKGNWLTCLVDQTDKIKNVGLIKISFVDGKTEISGYILEHGNIYSLKHIDCTTYRNKIYFEYEERNSRGMCVYRFEQVDGIDKINGLLFHHPDKGSGRIQGKRLKNAEKLMRYEVDEARSELERYYSTLDSSKKN